MSWGYHLILDCKGCDLASINSKPHIAEFIKTLIKRVDMVAHGDPQIEFLLPGTTNEGFSVLQMITTSNITAHFVNSTQEGYIDLFSCKQFNQTVAIETVKEYFLPGSIKVNYLER